MKRVIAFLGYLRENATPVSYVYGDTVYQGTVFPEALCQFLDFDQMTVFVTDGARQTSLPHLERLNDPRIQAIHIPDGRKPEERSIIFDKLVSVVEDGDTLIFDITHGFRSIPFFVFLAIAYLKSARQNVTIERVLYGELGVGGSPGPVIDLTEYVSLLDWMSATDRFIGFGNSQALVDLVKNAAWSGDGTDEDRVKMLQFANTLDDVSRSLHLVIPDRAMNAAGMLRRRLAEASEPLQQRLPPFRPLAARVDSAFSPLALAHNRRNVNATKYLAVERDIVFWYLQRKLLLQTIELAFEWLISYGAVYHTEGGNPFHTAIRQRVRKQFEILNTTNRSSSEATDALKELEPVDDLEGLLVLYHEVVQIRDTLLHASRTASGSTTPEAWEKRIVKVCDLLGGIPLPEGVTK